MVVSSVAVSKVVSIMDDISVGDVVLYVEKGKREYQVGTVISVQGAVVVVQMVYGGVVMAVYKRLCKKLVYLEQIQEGYCHNGT